MSVDVSFILITFNDKKIISSALTSLNKLSRKYKSEIFVVDNNSTDGTKELIKKMFKTVKLVELDKNTGTAAYNYAINKCKGRYIFFSGCDVEFSSDILEKLVPILEKDKKVAQVGPRYINYFERSKIDHAGTWLSRCFYANRFKDNTLGSKMQEIPFIGTGLIRTDIVRKRGHIFHSDYFFYSEDLELGLCLRLEGYKIMYQPSAIVYHHGSISANVHKKEYLVYLRERNSILTFFKILSVKNIILFFPYVMAMRFVGVSRDLLKFGVKCALARIKAILWQLFNIKYIIDERKIIQNTRKITDEELLKNFSEKYILKS